MVPRLRFPEAAAVEALTASTATSSRRRPRRLGARSRSAPRGAPQRRALPGPALVCVAQEPVAVAGVGGRGGVLQHPRDRRRARVLPFLAARHQHQHQLEPGWLGIMLLGME